MATQKFNTSKNTAMDVLSAKDTLAAVNSGRNIDLASGIRLGSIDKNYLNLSVKDGVTILEFNLVGMSSKNVRQWFDEVDARIRNLDASVRIKEKAFERILEDRRFLELVNDENVLRARLSSTGFEVNVNPDKGVDCIYTVFKTITCSYVLERMKIGQVSSGLLKGARTIERWTEITSKKNVTFTAWSGLCFHDSTVEEGNTYKYRLTLTNSKNKKTVYEDSVLYKKMDIVVHYFNAIPDPIEKKVHISYKVDNCVSLKITRVDNGKDFTNCQDDTNVEVGGKYKYVLIPSNGWGDGNKVYATADCTNVSPKIGKISIKKEVIKKGVTLTWAIATASKSEIIQRRLKGADSWTTLRKQSIKKATSLTKDDSYKDIDPSLRLGADYEYCIRCHNDWDDTDSPIAEVNMSNAVPQRPRMLPSDQLKKLKWVASSNVEKYDIVRFSDSALSDLKIPDSGFSEQVSGNLSYFIDSTLKMKKNVLYTYRIIAHNGWGISDPCYYDVVDRDISSENSFIYKGNSVENLCAKWVDDFQGMTTDGKYWYLTNGHGFGKLRKTPVEKQIGTDAVGDVKKKDEYHYGDLDYYKGYLFLPVYERVPHAQIWIIDANSMEDDFDARIDLLKPDGSYIEKLAWCAINPCDGRLYTSDGNDLYELYSYEIHLENLHTNKKVFQNARVIELRNYGDTSFESGVAIKESMQGGCFDYYNNLYLNSGCHPKRRDGIHVFRLVRDESKNLQCGESMNAATTFEKYRSNDINHSFDCYKAVLFAESQKDGDGFRYQFDSDGKYYYQEPQGLTYHDFRFRKNGDPKPWHDKMEKGSLHVALLENNGGESDQIFIKHYEHKFRDTEERNIYYQPSNLNRIEANDSFGGYKIVDNGTLVKRLKNMNDAGLAWAVLNAFDNCKVYTLGWLYTWEQNHDYTFSVCLCDTPLDTQTILNSINQINEKIKEANQKINTQSVDACIKTLSIDVGRYSDVVDEAGAEITYEDNCERYKIQLNDNNFFYAHNIKDAYRIIKILKGYRILRYIGPGPDADGRIRSSNNLIWLEK